jgi:hypothetical protein
MSNNNSFIEHFYQDGTTSALTDDSATTSALTVDSATEMYNDNTTKMINAVKDYNDRLNIKKGLNNKLSDSEVSLDELKNLSNTNKKKIEINLNTYRNILSQINVLKYVLLACGILIIIPILGKSGMLSKSTSIILWLICIGIMVCVIFYILVIKNINRDDIQFKEFNFSKPDEGIIANSKKLSQMSKRDKLRCELASELDSEFDPDSIDLDDSYILKNGNKSVCNLVN